MATSTIFFFRDINRTIFFLFIDSGVTGKTAGLIRYMYFVRKFAL
jgi:hypothetical protein